MTNKKLEKIEAIEKFLAIWKKKAFDYYNSFYQESLKINQENEKAHTDLLFAKQIIEKPLENEINEMFTTIEKMGVNDESRAYLETIHVKIKNKKQTMEPYWNKYKEAMGAVAKFIKENQSDIIWNSKTTLNQALDREVNKKRNILIKRAESKIGEIQDASNLSVGDNGEINGVVKGEKGLATITTIYAGGHNIQCLHYRVLVK